MTQPGGGAESRERKLDGHIEECIAYRVQMKEAMGDVVARLTELEGHWANLNTRWKEVKQYAGKLLIAVIAAVIASAAGVAVSNLILHSESSEANKALLEQAAAKAASDVEQHADQRIDALTAEVRAHHSTR